MTQNPSTLPSGIPSHPSLTSLEQELLATFQAWVLRLLTDPKAKPSQVLNAVRRLEMMRDFPMRQEKQARALALAEARIDLRRRSLALREALLQERLARAAEKKARSIAKETTSPKSAVEAPPTKAQSPSASTKVEKSAAPIVANKASEVNIVPMRVLSQISQFTKEPQSKEIDPRLIQAILNQRDAGPK